MASKKKNAAPLNSFEEAPQAVFRQADVMEAPGFGLVNRVKLTLGPGGRVVIPAALRQAMEVNEGDTILAWVEDGELHLLSPRVGGRRAQGRFAKLAPPNVSLVDELLAERRAEAAAER